jgi:hypothetical protein
MDDRRLPGGVVNGAVLVDGTVRRPVGPWTPAVHALLDHLASAGFNEAPRALGFDDEGREVLTYIPGDTIGDGDPLPAWTWGDATLAQAAGTLRRYHDAVSDFVPPLDAAWRFGRGLRPEEIICHNDIGPYNLVWRDRVVGLIDWDFAGPAEAWWDLAYAAVTFAPLHHPGIARPSGAPDMQQAPRRLRLFVDAYGLDDRTGFIDRVLARVEARATDFVRLAEDGDPAMKRLLANGHLSDQRRTADHIRRNRSALEVALS